MDKKRILLITFSQTGQTPAIAKSLLSGLNKEVILDHIVLEANKTFPFPWTSFDFFSVMPDTVLEKELTLKPFSISPNTNYDLVLLGWQPWFLSVNQPILQFLKDPQMAPILKSTPLISFLGCRNMWVSANEKMKKHLAQLGVQHVGQLAMVNKSHNLISLITILAWMLKGIKKNYLGIFPDAGIDASYFEKLPAVGAHIQHALDNKDWTGLQENINKMGFNEVKPALILMEKTGSGNFIKIAKWIERAPNEEIRMKRIKQFSVFLPFMIVLLTPIISILRPIQVLLKKKQLKKEAEYIKSLTYEAGRFHKA